MKNNSELQKAVQNSIKREPLLHAAEIGDIVKDGVVSLTGEVDSYAEKIEGENATKKVTGVKAVVENVKVNFPHSCRKSNIEIADEILRAFRLNRSVLKGKITVEVEDGWVTLDGEFAWNYQKEAARNAVQHLSGVKGVTNNIKIKPTNSKMM